MINKIYIIKYLCKLIIEDMQMRTEFIFNNKEFITICDER